ncbi:MAG: hypothetical protein HN392_09675 [Anaerolineae bacterium]|nr:hypothetical protein [Anaerolineae bacterium]MBT7073987.1 hypothetical protein [Anaerolineae bacterium]MBT7782299.1 hypothetical protein [Anaerolineae bacterium]
MEYSDDLTWDHVLPVSWYPESTPKNIEKWKVPACLSCNRRLGKIEEDLLVRLGLCLDPNSIPALGIPHKTRRSVNPVYGRNEKDRKARTRKREKILDEITWSKTFPKDGILPNFRPKIGLRYDDYPLVYIPDSLLREYNEKIVRGIIYVVEEKKLDLEYIIELIITEDNDDSVARLFQKPTHIYDRGYGFVIKQISHKDNCSWLFEFNIWDRFVFYASVYPQ